MIGIISDIQPICERLSASVIIVPGVYCNYKLNYKHNYSLTTTSGLILRWPRISIFEQFVKLMFGCFAQLCHKRERWFAYSVMLA
jgi:hypothetical protein